MQSHTIAVQELVSPAPRDTLGESPWWSVAEQRLVWVDIWGRRVRSAGLDGTDYREWATSAEVAFAIPTVPGAHRESGEQPLLVGLRHGLAELDPRTGTVTPGPVVESREGHRLNEGRTDPAGRLWFGTMREDAAQPTAAFYRYDDRGVVSMLEGITTANGLGWSPEGDRLYCADSAARRIVSFEYDRDQGELGQGRIFATDPQGYVPDGLAVDDSGCVWSAKWDGGRLVRYRPDGQVDLEFLLPVSRPTSCVFAGPRLDVLVVTSAVAAGPDDALELDGAVLLLDVGAAGLALHPALLP